MWVYVFWPLYFISFFLALLMRKKNSMDINNRPTKKLLKNQSLAKRLGTVTLFISVIYYILLCGVLGWEPFNTSVIPFIMIVTVFILDWFLVTFKYTKNGNERIFGIKLYWVSLLYRVTRGGYIGILFCALALSIIGGPFLFISVGSMAVAFVPEFAIEYVRNQIVPNQIADYRFFRREHMYSRISSDNHKFIIENPPYHDYVITNKSSGSAVSFHVYRVRCSLFKEYLYSFSDHQTNYSNKIYSSLNYDTIYIGLKRDLTPINRITKEGSHYIHTIARKDPDLKEYWYDWKDTVTIRTNPEKFRTEIINLQKLN